MNFITKTTYFDKLNIETTLFSLILINKSNIIWILKIISLTLHSLIRTAVPYIGEGLLAEWLGTGLQNRLRRFESARDLQGKKRVDLFNSLSSNYGSSSVGRALVSNTRCREFEPLDPCELRLTKASKSAV